jgi:hypothetical protein
MVWRRITPALAVMALMTNAAWAQSNTPANDGQDLPRQIRDKLTAEGFKDVQVAAGSYVVSAKDKDGNRVMMLIGPTSMSVMKMPDPSTAQSQDDKDEIIQQ